jgi:very-short-patch-repair endonuclease
MATSKPETRSAAAWALARAQHGVVARRQLEALGFTPAAIKHRLGTGRLHLAGRGVYLVGWPGLSRNRRWMAAVLACGEGAALSHRSAAARWGIARERRGPVSVTVRRRCHLERAGIDLHIRAALPDERFTAVEGIPLTAPVQTLVDLATELGDTALERAVNEADKFDLVDPEALRGALDDYRGVPGAKRLRALLDRHTFRLSDSDLEVFFRPLAAAVGLPVPLSRQRLLGFEVDFLWPALGLIVEADGLRYHRTPAQQSRAVLREQTHTAAGFRVLRFTHWQIRHDPDHVRGILARTQELGGWASPRPWEPAEKTPVA